jgi:hypothetical protein
VNTEEYAEDSADNIDDLLQAEALPDVQITVPVAVQGPVRTRALPAKARVMRTWALDPGQDVQLAGHEPRRASLTVWEAVGTVFGSTSLGTSQSEARQVTGVRAPAAGVPVVLADAQELWAFNPTAAPIIVCVSQSFWTE